MSISDADLQWIEDKIESQEWASQRVKELIDARNMGLSIDESEIAELIYILGGYDEWEDYTTSCKTTEAYSKSTQKHHVTRELNQPKFQAKKYFLGTKFYPVTLAQDIIENYLWMYSDGQSLYWYNNGVYKPGGENEFKRTSQILLGGEWRKNYVAEALEWTKQALIPPDKTTINANDGYINVQNGLINWVTGELIEHTPDKLSTIQLPVIYDPSANDPVILDFIHSVLPEDTVETVFEMIGYCLIPTTKHEKAIMLYGPGGNGKSTFINLLTALIGQVNMSNISLQDLDGHRFKVAQLQSKLVNAFADLPRNGISNASNFKAIVSGDVINAEHKHGTPFEFKPFAKLVYSANELPRSADLSDGFYRRWLIIPFTKKFTSENRDANLITKLTTESARSTLLNRAIEGLRRLDAHGFTESQTATRMLEQYRKENDNIAFFVDERCEIGETFTCLTTGLYEAYQLWCVKSGLKPLGNINFGKRLIAFNSNLDNTRRRKGDTCKHWTGIRLK